MSGTNWVLGPKKTNEDCEETEVLSVGLEDVGSEVILSDSEAKEDSPEEGFMLLVLPDSLPNETNASPDEEPEPIIHIDLENESGEEIAHDDGDCTIDTSDAEKQIPLHKQLSNISGVGGNVNYNSTIKTIESSGDGENVTNDKVRKVVQVRKIITTSGVKLDIKRLATEKQLVFGNTIIKSTLQSKEMSDEKSPKKNIRDGCSGYRSSRDKVIVLKRQTWTEKKAEESGLENTNNTAMASVKRRDYEKFLIKNQQLNKLYSSKTLSKEMMETLSEDDKKRTCIVCYKQFLNPKVLQEHYHIHTIDIPFSCEHCGQMFDDKHALKLHQREHRGLYGREESPVHECEVCNKTFRELFYLKQHRSVHTGDQKYICDHCGREFELKMSLVKHIVVHAVDRCWQCKVCFRKFRFKSALRVHTLSFHEEKKAPSDKKKTPVEHATLTRTRLVGKQKRTTLKHCCEQCGKLFWKSQNLETHLRVHETENLPEETRWQMRENTLFGCVECGIAIFGRSNYYAHKRSHGPKNRTMRTPEELAGLRRFPCDICGAKYLSRSEVNRHMRIHTEQRSYSCKVCGERFTWNQTRDEHQMTHDCEKRGEFTCKVCGSVCENDFLFAKHNYSHTGQKPIVCDYCLRGFMSKSNFAKHLRVHDKKIENAEQGEKEDAGFKLKVLHDCEVCGKYFSSRHVRKQHMLIHTGAKPFVCDRCPKSFNQKSNLTRHMQVHDRRDEDEEKRKKYCLTPFAEFKSGEFNDCEFCEKKFRSKVMYDEHMYTHTGVRAFACTVCSRSFGQRSNFWRHLRTHKKLNVDKDKWTEVGQEVEIQQKESLQSQLDKLTDSLTD